MSMTLLPETLCPAFDRLADEAMTGGTEAIRRLDTHVAECASCAEAARLADVHDDSLAACLAPLADVTCPPHVVEEALAEATQAAPRAARRAGDRAAVPFTRRAPRRWRTGTWVVALVALVTVVALVTGPDLAPPVAEGPAEGRPLDDERTAEARPAPTLASVEPSVEPSPSVAPPAPQPVAATRTVPLPPVSLLETTALVAATSAPPTAADTAAAVAGAQLAFALVGRAQQEAASAVAPELRRPQETLESTHVL